MGTRVVASALALLALAFSACPHGSVYFAQVRVGPPAPVLGPVGVAPGPGWVWTDGYYSCGGGGWAWQPGRWARPPHPGYVWRKPFYQRYRNGYRVHHGRWVRP